MASKLNNNLGKVRGVREMLGLLLEIGLTIAAVRGGWRKSVAILPLGLTYFVCFMMGLAVGASGGSIDGVMGIALLLEVICIGTLIAMVIFAPKRRRKPEAQQAPKEVLQPSTAQ